MQRKEELERRAVLIVIFPPPRDFCDKMLSPKSKHGLTAWHLIVKSQSGESFSQAER